MSNLYFTYTPLVANAVARAADVNTRLQGVETAFDMLPDPDTFGLSLRRLVTAGGTANAITVTNSPPILAYNSGQRISFVASNTNTGAVTINVDGVGVVALNSYSGTALGAGEITTGSVYEAVYTGGSFRLTSLTVGVLGGYITGAQTAATNASSSATAAATSATSASGSATSAANWAAAANTSANAASTSATNAAGSATAAANSASAAAATLSSANLANYVTLAGTQTITGGKTFSVIPTIPDEGYSSSWTGKLEPATKNAIRSAFGQLPTLSSGTYVPTITGVNNVDGPTSTAFACQFLQVGNVVTVSGKITLHSTFGGATNEADISLPVATTFTGDGHGAGVAAHDSSVNSSEPPPAIKAVGTKLRFSWTALNNVSYTFWFTATYLVE